MATTLTLGTTPYALTNNASFNNTTGLSLFNLSGNDAITIGADAGTQISGSAGAGNDTLTVTTNLTGAGGTILTGGGGNDSITLAAGVKLTAYSVQGGTDNDTLVINGIMAGGSVQGNEGADSIVLGAASIIGGGTVQLDNATTGPMGADTLVLGNLTAAAFNNSSINQFSRSADTLIVGAATITSTDWGTIAAGTYTGATLAAAATSAGFVTGDDIFALSNFLSSNGTANITII